MAEFALNFKTNPNAVNSVADQSCNAGTPTGGMMGGMGMAGMMGFGPGCGSSYFIQELVSDPSGSQFYHVIVGNPATDSFALEFYIGTGAGFYFNGGGMGGGMGGMMGGPAPTSASYGVLSNPNVNTFTPLSNDPAAGNGTGNPTKVYMQQINKDPNMTQNFLKATMANKPNITQTITSGTAMTSAFNINMSNGGYSAYTKPSSFTNTTTVAGVGSFNAAASPTANVDGGAYRYTAGSGFGGSYGTYNYQSGSGLNLSGVNWLSYCEASQNPDSGCVFTSGNGMMGGMMGM